MTIFSSNGAGVHTSLTLNTRWLQVRMVKLEEKWILMICLMQLFSNCNGTKNSCIRQIDDIHFSYKVFFVNTTFHKVHILTLKWKYLKHQH